MVLEMAGASVTLVGDGAQAIEALRTRPDCDAVLMDCQMPVMDGYEATRALRADPLHTKRLIIAMTAEVSDDERKRIRDAGMDDHIPKPFDPHTMVALIARRVAEQRG
jgi:CheY-like chemotaxis protein